MSNSTVTQVGRKGREENWMDMDKLRQRWVGFGLACACLLACFACVSAPPATDEPGYSTATPTAAATRQPSPIVTNTILPATPSATLVIATSAPTPQTAFTTTRMPPADVPSRLSTAAQAYIATTEPDAIAVARRLNYLANDGHPSNMSGPLALAILRDAGIVSDTVKLHNFWLLDPQQNENLLEATFPRAQFLWFQTATPIHQFDFSTFPLQAGDLLYLAAGDSGTFDQFLVVTRLDAEGRAFTITNRNTPQGYVVDEMAVTDLFAIWTDHQNGELGLTGFGGFWLWRQRQVVGDSPVERLAYAASETLITYGGEWQVIIRQTDGVVLFAHNAEERVHIASVIKIPIAILFLKSVEANAGPDLENYLDTTGVDGRSYRQLLEAMLVRSEEKATASLEAAITDSDLDIEATLNAWGMINTQIAARQSSAHDVAQLLAGLEEGLLVPIEARKLLLDWLSTYTPNDDSRLGILRQEVPGVQVYNKRGTLTEPFLIVADAALITRSVGDQTVSYEIVVMARNSDDTTPATYEHLDQAIAEIADWFARYLLEIEEHP